MSAKKITKKHVQATDDAKKMGQTVQANPKKTKQDPIFRKALQRKRDKIMEELSEFQQSTSLVSVLSKDWMFSSKVPLPSIELLSYLGHEMLYGEKSSKFKLRAAHSGIYDAQVLLVQTISGYGDVARQKSVEHAVARFQILEWIHGEDRAHWALFRANMGSHPVDQFLQIGAHFIAQHVIESLVLRCIKSGDWKHLGALRNLIKTETTGEGAKRKAVEEITLCIFTWHGHLEQMLGRLPSREEMRDFGLNLQLGLSNRKESWTDAQRLLHFQYAAPRNIRMDSHQITKLALEAQKTGPIGSVNIPTNPVGKARQRLWRKPPI